MFTEKAFQEAEAQGYRCVNRIVRCVSEPLLQNECSVEIDRDYAYTLGDPAFWKALGVARGWSQHERVPKWVKEEGTSLIIFYPDNSWASWMHQYNDHAIENGAGKHQDFFKQFYSVE